MIVAVASSVGVVWFVRSVAAVGPNAGDPTRAEGDGLPLELWLLVIVGALALGGIVFRLILLAAGAGGESPRHDDGRQTGG
ncbi:MAG TPA: hypothetical protein VF533_00725 [Solirubrobacteraceae bacterium]